MPPGGGAGGVGLPLELLEDDDELDELLLELEDEELEELLLDELDEELLVMVTVALLLSTEPAALTALTR